jgi:hypothetical protein
MHRVGCGGLLVLAAALLAAGCGSSDVTTNAGSSAAPADPDQCLPMDLSRLPQVRSPSDASREGGRQQELMGDAGRARQYGQAHPDTFNNVWFDYRDEQWFLAVGFKSGVDEHRAALRALVEHPDRLLVCRTATSSADGERILSELRALPNDDGQLSSFGVSVDRIFVNLRADQEKLAKELYDKYSPSIDITLGVRPYPPRPYEPGAPGSVDIACPALDVVAAPNGVRITVEPASSSFASGANSKASVVIQNGSTTDYAGSQGFIVVVQPGTRTVVGTYAGPRELVLRGFNAAAGGTGTYADTYGTAPCGPGDGYTLPKGTYEIVATLNITGVGTVVSEPARIELT